MKSLSIVDFSVFDPADSPDLRRSSPHLVDLASFQRAFGGSHRRSALLERLDDRLFALVRSGVIVEAALVGGSFTTNNPDPADLDALIAYRLEDGAEDGGAVQEMARKESGLDLRFIPIDGDPAISMKVIAFFAMMYAFDKINKRNIRPLFVIKL